MYGPNAATNQLISVQAINTCGNSTIRNLAGITVTSCIREGDLSGNVFNIYPNPAHDQFELFYQTKENVSFTIEMMDAEGRLVNTKSIVGNGLLYSTRYETAELARGVYLIVVNEEGRRLQQRVVVY
ncbi:MAG: T9SS type A sorting domain-containing protein [Bacteroidetes bacterium]|nr:T9SS type A sorting domain-containing protein [Bacteroidota bacterium]